MENRRILFLCDGFRKADLGTDLISNAFQWSIQNTRFFPIFSSFIFCSIIYFFEKRKGEEGGGGAGAGIFLLTLKG